MNMSEGERSLADAAVALGERVNRLATHVTVSQRQVDRMRFLSTLIALMAIVSLVGVVISIYLWTRVHHTSDDIRQTQVISCQTNNDVRQANAELWGFVLDSSEASNPMTAKQKLQVEKLRDWITKLYEPRDCSQLNKKYTIPPPPPIIKR